MSSISLSVDDIEDAFFKILKWIKGLPIVKLIEKGIDQIIRKGIEWFYDPIRKWLKDTLGLELPEFPKDISVSMLNFDGLTSAKGSNSAKVPDLKKLVELPLKGFDFAVKKFLPKSQSKFASCGADLSCVGRGLGLGNLDVVVYAVPMQMEVMPAMRNLTHSLIAGMECKKWGVQSVPLADILDKIGIKTGEFCNVDIDYCESLIFDSTTQKTLEDLKTKFKPMIDGFEKVVKKSGRRLKAGVFHHEFISLMSFAVSPAGLAMEKGLNPNSIGRLRRRYLIDLTKELDGIIKDYAGDISFLKGLNQPFAFEISVDASVNFQLGLILTGGEPSFGINIGAKLDAKLGAHMGSSSLMVEAIRIANSLNEFDQRPECETCPRACKSGRSGDSAAACMHIATAKSDLGTIPRGCDLNGMKKLQDSMSWPFETDLRKRDSSSACIKYWFDTDSKVSTQLLKFSEAEASEGTSRTIENTKKLFGEVADLDQNTITELIKYDYGWVGDLHKKSTSLAKKGGSATDWPWENLSDKIKFSVGGSFGGDSAAFYLGPSCSFGGGMPWSCKMDAQFNPQKLLHEFAGELGKNAEKAALDVWNGGGGVSLDWAKTKRLILKQLDHVNPQVFLRGEYSHVFDPIAAMERAGGGSKGGRRGLVEIDTTINGTLQFPEDAAVDMMDLETDSLFFPLGLEDGGAAAEDDDGDDGVQPGPASDDGSDELI